MGTIKRLSEHEAQKIAAGEVVERPANIVKELIENAIDAQATRVTIHIEDGGKKLIQILDDGCGIAHEDRLLAFERHATSKVSTIDDLDTVGTFGFRGEALASIASVARVTLTTKTAQAKVGIQVTVCGSALEEEKEVACLQGTQIAIKDLFFNLPARHKFLKKRETEWRHILGIVQAFCLDYHDIHFKLFSEGKLHLNCAPTSSLAQRVQQLFAVSHESDLISVEAEHPTGALRVSGTISKPHTVRYDRGGLFLFVNRRWITNHHLVRALLKGYDTTLPPGKYPIGALHISIDPTFVDVNVHPRKEEVKFIHPRIVENTITHAVTAGLEASVTKQIQPTISSPTNSYSQPISPQSEYTFTHKTNPTTPHTPIITSLEQTTEPFVPFDFSTLPAQVKTPAQPGPEPIQKFTEQKPLPSTQEQATNTHIANDTGAQLIGQYHNTYILAHTDDGLLIVDQHAAHERILYEKFGARFEEIPTISLLFPQTISLSIEQIQAIIPHLNLLKQNGIVAEPFGDDSIIIRSTPVHLKDTPLTELIQEALGFIAEYEHLDETAFTKTLHEKLRAQMACKAAIKAGDTLDTTKMSELLRTLANTNNRFSCPHGRPTSITLTLDELEKKFKRKA